MPLLVEAEFLVVEAEQMERGGVEVVAVGGCARGLEAEFIGLAVAVPPLMPPPASQAVKAPGLWSRPLSRPA